jgi:ABC-2 type transport system ATP-binding protein
MGHFHYFCIMSIEVEQLVKTYGNQYAVNGISFGVKSGEIVGFLGPNGAGKSTTMKMLTGYLQATSGKAVVAGFDMNTQALEAKKNIGYLPESNPLYTEMFVKEYLHFIASLHGFKKDATQRVQEMIDKTGLSQEQHKKIHQLSKGYKQRVGLAQAMMHNPQVLILDEPTSGLDPNQIGEIRKLIRDFGQNRTILLSTHIMQEVKAMCSRVIIINKGELVADGAVEELQKQFAGRQIIHVQFKNTADENALKNLFPGIKAEHHGNNRFRIEADIELPVKEALFKWAVETGNVIMEQSQQEQSLEEVFQQLTHQHA